MIVDAETLELSNSIEELLEEVADDDGRHQARAHGVGAARSRPTPVPRHGARPASSCAGCAARSSACARERGLAIGSAGTHPFAMWEDQRIVARPRYRDLVERAAVRRAPGAHLRHARPRRPRRPRQGDPRRQRDARPRAGAARAVGQLAVLARATRPACVSTRTPIFRAFPRVGIPPRLQRLGGLRSSGSASWSTSGVMEDYTYLWYDVRPHPNFGTVEIRVMRLPDARRAHARRSPRSSRRWSRSWPSTSTPASSSRDYPCEMLDENKWLAARHGLDGELVDLPEQRARRRRAELARRLLDRLREHAEDLGLRPTSSTASRTCSSAATAPAASSSSTRPTTTCARSWREIVDGDGRPAPTRPAAQRLRSVSSRHGRAGRTSSSSARTAGREVSPYITECPYCGSAVRKRAPKIERGRAPAEPKRTPQAPRAPSLAPLRPARSRASAATSRARGHDRADRARRSSALLVCALAIDPAASTTAAGSFDPLGEWWQLVTAAVRPRQPLGYQFAALAAVGVFGWLLERRHGPLVVLLAVRRCAGRRRHGALRGARSSPTPVAVGANGGGARPARAPGRSPTCWRRAARRRRRRRPARRLRASPSCCCCSCRSPAPSVSCGRRRRPARSVGLLAAGSSLVARSAATADRPRLALDEPRRSRTPGIRSRARRHRREQAAGGHRVAEQPARAPRARRRPSRRTSSA